MSRFKRFTVVLLLVFAVIPLLCLMVRASPAVVASSGNGPAVGQQAPTSIIVEHLGDFDYDDDTFSAAFWISVETRATDEDPLVGLQFTNAEGLSVDQDSRNVVVKGDTRIYRQRVHGRFHHAWNLSRYPFDREQLRLIVEDTEQTPGSLRPVVNASASGLRGMPATIGEWRIQGFSFKPADPTVISSSFSPLNRSSDKDGSASLVFTIKLVNAQTQGAFKLLAGGIIAVAITSVTYVLTPDIISNPNSRFGALTAGVFASVISMRSSFGLLGNIQDLTLIDKLYMLIFVYIFFAFAFSSYLWKLNADPAFSGNLRLLSYRAGVISLSTLALLMAIVTISVARG